MKQEEIEKVEVYYEQIHKQAHGLQVPTTYSFLTTCVWSMFAIIFQNCDYRDEVVNIST